MVAPHGPDTHEVIIELVGPDISQLLQVLQAEGIEVIEELLVQAPQDLIQGLSWQLFPVSPRHPQGLAGPLHPNITEVGLGQEHAASIGFMLLGFITVLLVDPTPTAWETKEHAADKGL